MLKRVLKRMCHVLLCCCGRQEELEQPVESNGGPAATPLAFAMHELIGKGSNTSVYRVQMSDGSFRALRRGACPSVSVQEAAVVRALTPYVDANCLGNPQIGSSGIICDLVEYDLLDWILQANPTMANRDLVAEKVKTLVDEIHTAGCTFHDLKLENLGIRPGTMEIQLLDYNAVSVGRWNGTGGTWYAAGEWAAIMQRAPYDHRGVGDRFRLGVLLFGLLFDRHVPHIESNSAIKESYRVRYGILQDHVARHTVRRPDLTRAITELLGCPITLKG